MECKFNNTTEKAERAFSDPLFKGTMICGENLSVTFHRKKSVKLNQSWAVGFSILEISKLVMQKLWYEKIRERFDGNARVMMSDTDSWILQVPAKSEEMALEKLKDVMDFSNYNPKHQFHNLTRKNKLGFLKNEVPNGRIREFVGIRSKTYAFVTNNIIFGDDDQLYEIMTSDEENLESRAKGVKKAFKRKILFQDYKDCLINKQTKSIKQIGIISKNHVNYLIESEKIAFSSFDDKRYLLCAIHSCPYGSSLIDYFNENNGSCFMCDNPSMIF